MFNNENFDEEEDKEREELLTRFENFINNNQPSFFSIQEFIEIINYYILERNVNMTNKALKTGLQHYPDDPLLLLKKAEILAIQNYTTKALHLLNKIEPQLNTVPEFYLARANIYSQMGLHKWAINDYKKLLPFNCFNNDLIYNLIGNEYLMQNKIHNALNYFKKSIYYNPDTSDEAFYKTYFCYTILENLNEGIKYFQEIIDKYPFNAKAWVYTSLCYYDLNDFENALEYINFAHTIHPDDILIIMKKCAILRKLNKYNEAITLLEDTLKNNHQNSNNHHIMIMLGQIYNAIYNFNKATQYFHKALQIDSKNTYAWLGLADAYFNLNQDKEALSCIQQTIKNANNDPEILLSAAKLLIQLEMFEEALDILSQIHTGYESTELIVSMSIALEKSGYPSEAVTLLTDEIHNKLNEDVELQYCLASILLLYQYRQDGLSTLEKALQTDPTKHSIIYEFNPLFANDIEIQELIHQYSYKDN